MMLMFTEFAEDAYSSKAAMVIKYILPIIGPILDDSKVEVKRSVQALVQVFIFLWFCLMDVCTMIFLIFFNYYQALFRAFGGSLMSQPQITKLSAINIKKLEEML